MNEEKLQSFADLLEAEQIERLVKDKLDCEANINNCKVEIIEGQKYTKVNVGHSGKYMVDCYGLIYGIKGYGKIHPGHKFGTLDTIDQWDWSGYNAVKKQQI